MVVWLGLLVSLLAVGEGLGPGRGGMARFPLPNAVMPCPVITQEKELSLPLT